jgi:5-deoxy-D-glucuronate isomerase
MRLLEAGVDGRIGCARSRGPLRVRTGTAAAWMVVESGRGRARADALDVDVSGRGDVFAGVGWSALAGPATTIEFAGDLAVTVVWCAARDTASGIHVIDPATVDVAERGEGPTARTVRTYLPRGDFVAGETLNPAGGWSSWPPHAHEHEEIYLYRFGPQHGFGVHVDLGADVGAALGDAPRVVRDGDVVRIRSGHHPVVSAPGCAMYYLWALVGDQPTPDTRIAVPFG